MMTEKGWRLEYSLAKPLYLLVLFMERSIAVNQQVFVMTSGDKFSCERYDIYRSYDGNRWQVIGSVPCVSYGIFDLCRL